MRQSFFVFSLVFFLAITTLSTVGLAQQAGPYSVLKKAKTGGEGGWDYIYADAAGSPALHSARSGPRVRGYRYRARRRGSSGAAYDLQSGHARTGR